MFVYGQNLLFIGNWIDIIIAFISGGIGVFCISASVQGWLLKKAGWVERVVLFAAALLLIKQGIYTDMVGISLLFLVLVYQRYGKGKVP